MIDVRMTDDGCNMMDDVLWTTDDRDGGADVDDDDRDGNAELG